MSDNTVFAPDGTVRSIPDDQLQAALNSGGKRAVKMLDPQGTQRYIPEDMVPQAQQAGGKLIQQQTFNPDQEGMQAKPSGFYGDLKNMVTGAPQAVAHMLPGVGPIMDAKADYDSLKATGMTIAEANNARRKAAGYGPAYRAIAPIGEAVGVNAQGMEQSAAQGDQMGVLGHAAAAAVPLVASELAGGMMRTPQGQAIAGKVGDAVSNIQSPKDRFYASKVGNVAAAYPEAAKLPVQAQAGAEQLFQAAAPTGSNTGFRSSLYKASGDLAEIARNSDISDAKGGIVAPDMRVKATVNAINDHLSEIYQNEVAPQIARTADHPVNMQVGEDSTNGLQYLARNAKDAPIREIAKKALSNGSLNMTDSAKLRVANNQALMEMPDATATGRRVGGLESLDSDLKERMGTVLQNAGEAGVDAPEQRFAALSAVRDQLQSRINATELARTSISSKIAKPVLSAFTGGKSGIASASQAAVADVNIGRSLQQGLKNLADSGIEAERVQGTGKPQLKQLGTGNTQLPASTQAPPIENVPPMNYPASMGNRTLPPATTRLMPDPSQYNMKGEPINVPGEVLPANYKLVRDPKTGQMKKMYLTGAK